MIKRDDYLKGLKENEVFAEVLKRASSDAERRIIQAYAEEFLNVFYDNVVTPISKELQKDPQGLNNAVRIVEEQLINSGSTKT